MLAAALRGHVRQPQVREDAGPTQAQVTKRLGRWLSKCELGGRRVDFVELEDLARAYGKPLEWFGTRRFPDSSPPKPWAVAITTVHGPTPYLQEGPHHRIGEPIVIPTAHRDGFQYRTTVLHGKRSESGHYTWNGEPGPE